MSRKRPSHESDKDRRTRPIGPVHGIAIARALPHAPTWEEGMYEPAGDY